MLFYSAGLTLLTFVNKFLTVRSRRCDLLAAAGGGRPREQSDSVACVVVGRDWLWPSQDLGTICESQVLYVMQVESLLVLPEGIKPGDLGALEAVALADL